MRALSHSAPDTMAPTPSNTRNVAVRTTRAAVRHASLRIAPSLLLAAMGTSCTVELPRAQPAPVPSTEAAAEALVEVDPQRLLGIWLSVAPAEAAGLRGRET